MEFHKLLAHINSDFLIFLREKECPKYSDLFLRQIRTCDHDYSRIAWNFPNISHIRTMNFYYFTHFYYLFYKNTNFPTQRGSCSGYFPLFFHKRLHVGSHVTRKYKSAINMSSCSHDLQKNIASLEDITLISSARREGRSKHRSQDCKQSNAKADKTIFSCRLH